MLVQAAALPCHQRVEPGASGDLHDAGANVLRDNDAGEKGATIIEDLDYIAIYDPSRGLRVRGSRCRIFDARLYEP